MNQDELNDAINESLDNTIPNIEEIQRLVQAGAEIHSKALKNARSKGQIEIVNILLINNAKFTKDDFLYMCKHGCISAIEIMLEKLGDDMINVLEYKDEDGDSALHIVCQNDHVELAKFIIQKFGDKAVTALQVKNSQNNTSLYEACRNKNDVLAKFIIEKLGDEAINVLQEKNNDNDTSMHLACYNGHIDLVKIMLEKLGNKAVAALQDENTDNDTALHLECQNNNDQIAKIIIEKLGNKAANVIQHKGSYQETPLYIAFQNVSADLVNMMISTLINNKYDINDILKYHGYDVHNFLMLACLKGNNNVIKHLIDYGATMDIRDIDAWSDVFQKVILKGDSQYFDSIILCNNIDTNSVEIFEIITDNLEKNVIIQNALEQFNLYVNQISKKSAYKVYIESDDENITNNDGKKSELKRLKEEICEDVNQPQQKIQFIEGMNSLIDQAALAETDNVEKLLGENEG